LKRVGRLISEEEVYSKWGCRKIWCVVEEKGSGNWTLKLQRLLAQGALKERGGVEAASLMKAHDSHDRKNWGQSQKAGLSKRRFAAGNGRKAKRKDSNKGLFQMGGGLEKATGGVRWSQLGQVKNNTQGYEVHELCRFDVRTFRKF